MHDDDAVARQVDVELEPVGAKREAVIERGDGVLRPERRAAAVRVHERSRGAVRAGTLQRTNLSREFAL